MPSPQSKRSSFSAFTALNALAECNPEARTLPSCPAFLSVFKRVAVCGNLKNIVSAITSKSSWEVLSRRESMMAFPIDTRPILFDVETRMLPKDPEFPEEISILSIEAAVMER